VRDPYPALARLRAEDPVFFSRERDGWILTRYDDCLEVLRDHDRFASDTATARGRLGEHMRGLRGGSPLGDRPLFGQSDPPDHPRLRAVIDRAFTPRIVDAHRAEIERHIEALVGAVEPGRPFDLMRGLAEPLPVLVIGDLLGLDDANRHEVRAHAQAVMRGVAEAGLTATARRAAEDSREWLRAYLARYADEHGDDGERPLIRMLFDAEVEGGRLSVDEVLAFAVFLYTAGSGPTAGLIANGLAALLRHPEQLARLREEPSRIAAATDELLRYDSPPQALIRVATAETRIGRRRIATGGALFLMVGAANRDPEAFPDPDALDVARERASRHLSFGRSSHFCLGAPLAQLETELLYRVLFERFASLEIAEGGFAWGGTMLLRVPREMIVVAR